MSSNTTTTSTTTATSEVALTENRPRVISLIQNDEITYESSGSNLKLFSSFISEKGKDNTIVSITSPSEYISKFGNPSLSKYGQESYNNIKWLKGGGEVLCLRVMPENASYSHAFLDIQTKVSKKEVLDKDGNKVEYDNVFLRPAIFYNDTDNTTLGLLEETLKTSEDRTSVDGYKNHLIFAVYPEGRGKYYNNLGFRLTLNKQYDSVYDYRIYNFEVVQFNNNGTADIKEGPYFVSFNPDALSSSQESLYIEDVLNNYCTLLKCKCNSDEFVKLAKIINSDANVNPYDIDPIFCLTKEINDEKQQFYCEQTKKFEDVQMSIYKYDINGNPIEDTEGNPVVNTVDSNDVIEQSIVVADNSYRKSLYSKYLSSLEDMKKIFNSVDKNTFLSILDDLLLSLDGNTLDGGTIKEDSKKLKDYLQEITNSVKIFNTSFLDSDFQKLVNQNKLMTNLIDKIVDDCLRLLNYNKSIQIDSFTLEIESLLNNALNLKNLKEITDMKAVSKKDEINEVSNKILEIKANGDKYDKEDSIPDILSTLKSKIDYLISVIGDYKFSDSVLVNIIKAYNSIIDKYNATSDKYLSEASKERLISEIYSDLPSLANDIFNELSITICDLDLYIMDSIVNQNLLNAIQKLALLNKQNKSLYSDTISSSKGISELKSIIRKNLENQSLEISKMSSLLFTIQLQNVDTACRLGNGSDGDLDDSNQKLKSKTLKSLLVKAYSGLIDDKLTNTRVLPFNFILDANYPIEVKNAIVSLVQDIRRDFLYIADTEFKSNPEQTLQWKKQYFPINTNLVALYAHDFIVYDEYNAKDIKVTMPYFLSTKIPTIAKNYGLQYPIAGNKRGVIDGFKSVNFVPNDIYQEKMYNNRINYIISDEKRTKLNSQLTCGSQRTPLSDINNVIMLLQMQRDVKLLVEDYQFEFEDDDTMKNAQYAVNNYLNTYIDNRSCDEISATVYASDYDKKQHVCRVNIKIKFKNIVEVIIVTLDIVR